MYYHGYEQVGELQIFGHYLLSLPHDDHSAMEVFAMLVKVCLQGQH